MRRTWGWIALAAVVAVAASAWGAVAWSLRPRVLPCEPADEVALLATGELAVLERSGDLSVWSLPGLARVRAVPLEARRAVTFLDPAPTPHESYARLEVLRLADGIPLGLPEYTPAAFSPDRERVASARPTRARSEGWDPGTFVSTFSARTGELEREVHVPETEDTYTLAWSPDGSLLALAGSGSNDVIRLVSARDGRVVRTLEAPPLGLRGLFQWVAFSPDGRLVLGASTGYVRVWSTVDASLVATLRLESMVYGVAVSPRSDLAATLESYGVEGGWRGRLRLWSLPDGRCERSVDLEGLPRSELHWRNVAFTPESDEVAVVDLDGVVRLYPLPASFGR